MAWLNNLPRLIMVGLWSAILLLGTIWFLSIFVTRANEAAVRRTGDILPVGLVRQTVEGLIGSARVVDEAAGGIAAPNAVRLAECILPGNRHEGLNVRGGQVTVPDGVRQLVIALGGTCRVQFTRPATVEYRVDGAFSLIDPTAGGTLPSGRARATGVNTLEAVLDPGQTTFTFTVNVVN